MTKFIVALMVCIRNERKLVRKKWNGRRQSLSFSPEHFLLPSSFTWKVFLPIYIKIIGKWERERKSKREKVVKYIMLE